MNQGSLQSTQSARITLRLGRWLGTLGSVFISALSLLPSTPAAASEPQTHQLRLDALKVTIETSNDRLTSHFGPRFDRTAWVASIEVDGIELLGPWGLSDEFGLHGNGVLGFESASIGESFTKIGLGELIRDIESDYDFSHRYPVQQFFPIDVHRDETSLTIIQVAPKDSEWPYRYQKTYTLLPNAQLKIEYALTNLSSTTWSFEHYNHHWFRLENEPIGAPYSVATAFPLPESQTGLVRASHSLAMPGPLAIGQAQYYAGDLSNVSARHNRFQVLTNQHPIVDFQGSTAADRFALYADSDGFCPEIFTRKTLKPTETVRWHGMYQFSLPNRNVSSGE